MHAYCPMEDVRQRLGGMGLSGVTMDQLSEVEWKLGEIKVIQKQQLVVYKESMASVDGKSRMYTVPDTSLRGLLVCVCLSLSGANAKVSSWGLGRPLSLRGIYTFIFRLSASLRVSCSIHAAALPLDSPL